MKPLDRELLTDMGFVPGTGWDHEVWVYEGKFWVHFGEFKADSGYGGVHADWTTRRAFFELFIEAITGVEHMTPLE